MTGVEGDITSLRSADVQNEEFGAALGLTRVKEAFTLDPDYGVPEVTLSGGSVLIASGNDARELAPRAATLPLSDNTTNYIYLGESDGLSYHVAESETPPAYPAVKVAEVDTSADTATPVYPPGINRDNSVIVESSDDLPSPVNGYHPLEARPYEFRGFITSTAGLQLHPGGSPLLGRHGSSDGFIHVGGATAIKGDGAPHMMRDLYVHAPGATLYDLTADNTTEMLVESCAFSDAADLGNIATLGTVDGYRVPTWKGCNFEDFDGGLTFGGDPDKIFVWGSPLRRVTASNVDIFTLSSGTTVNIVDFADNYVKDVQSDTAVWNVADGAEPSEVFQYRGTTHDTSFTESNALTGPNADAQLEPFWVSDSHPVRDSAVVGELSLDASTTTTITTQDTYVQVEGATTLGNESERVSLQSAGVLQYNGARDTNVHITISASWYGANGANYEFAISKNGTVEPRSTVLLEGGGQNANRAMSTTGIEDLTNGDTVSFRVRNKTGTADVTMSEYVISFMGG